MTNFLTRRTTMVDTQIRPADVTKFPIIEAMLQVRREVFVPDHLNETAYADAILDLGHGRVILEPRTFAKMLDAVDIQGNELVLDIGCGLGYSSAVIGKFSEAVVSIEENEAMAAEAEANLAAEGCLNVAVVQGSLAQGAAQHAPFDVIVVQGAVERMPAALIEQLAEGGRIVAVFSQKGQGAVRVGYKTDGQMSWRFACNAFAPVLKGFMAERSFAL
ncbi:protein-L-isoaspartate O-methyltransferase [uncultured Planktomarina sp.]|uniref:protein-L-isoaspartate O-methyltransferase family protein n=1 Tax=uncultured Planktomarina sp. TaxID=1538529 RepID=UPI00325FE542